MSEGAVRVAALLLLFALAVVACHAAASHPCPEVAPGVRDCSVEVTP